jgi:hypothetical protein
MTWEYPFEIPADDMAAGVKSSQGIRKRENYHRGY